MGLSTEQISAVLNSKARQLSQPNAIPKSSGRSDMTDTYSKQGDMFLESLGYDNYDDDPEYQPRKLSEQELMAESAIASAPAFTSAGVKNSKMPEAIKKMMAESAIKEQEAAAQTQVPLNENLKAARAIMEKTGMVPQKQTSGGVNAVTIDYSVIKAVVSECLKEYFADKQPLNEGTIKGIKLKEGKISIIDNKGNIYSAQLQKVGNKNDKER